VRSRAAGHRRLLDPHRQQVAGAEPRAQVPGIATLNGSARYKSDYYTAFQNLPVDLTPARTIFDASLSYGIDNWRFSVFGHNLSNKVVQNGALVVAGLFSFETPTDPREWGAEVRFKFGKTH
jgi:outer membrane receptor protein involved in Fe transport